MLNRRLIRIKVFQALYAFLQDETPSLNKAKSYLRNSISGIDHNLYTVLLFPVELVHFVQINLNPEENKYLPTDEEVRAYNNMCFRELYDQIVRHPEISTHLAKPKHRWQDYPEVLRKAFKEVRSSDQFAEYLSLDNPSREDQVNAFVQLYNFFINDSEEFNQEMEEIEMLWEDEKVPIRNAATQVMRSILKNKPVKQVHKNDEETDWEFAEELLEKTVRFRQEYEDLIAGSAAKWDKDRIAKTDMVLMTMALAELEHFAYIPVKVTLNEYLELAKDYSTPQSSKFVNGILDRLVKQLREENRLVKKGRGMVG